MKNEHDFLEDFPPGPLDKYRKSASFNWKVLKLIIENEDILKFKWNIWKRMEDDPLFHHSSVTPSLDEMRHLATLRCKKICFYNFLPHEEFLQNPIKLMNLVLALSLYDPSLGLKYFVPFVFFTNSIRDLGTEKHNKFIQAAEREEISGCYALTEVAHGTNAKKMRTTATFDPKTQEFILHSEDFEAGKCWIGSLGKTSTHATVFAQLITPDGTNHGLHAFITPLRDPKTMLQYPGVLIGDMGEKLGLNGVDNGFAFFNRYRIPKDNLLDRVGSVTPDGKYVSPIKDPRKRFASSLTTLLLGRDGITHITTGLLSKAVVIAIRYSAVRQQFGPLDGEELPVIEYQLQQWRLFPYLAAAYAIKISSDYSSQCLVEFAMMMWAGADKDTTAALAMEIHALQSSAKGLGSWTAQQGIQECREACGGHGYLQCSGFGVLRNDNDAQCTYEGDNNVLCQQTSNWLLQLWAHRNDSSQKYHFPLGSVDFVYKQKPTSSQLTAATVEEISHPSVILDAYEWLVIWLLENTYKRYKNNCQGKDSFTARNETQVFFARTLSFVYIERYVIMNFWKFCSSGTAEGGEKMVLQRLCSLYGLWCFEKHLATLYESGYATGPQPSRLIRESIVQLCLQLKPDAVALADALALPDFILNSAIGKSDGKVYQNLQAALFQNPGVMERPIWWKDMVGSYKSKL